MFDFFKKMLPEVTAEDRKKWWENRWENICEDVASNLDYYVERYGWNENSDDVINAYYIIAQVMLGEYCNQIGANHKAAVQGVLNDHPICTTDSAKDNMNQLVNDLIRSCKRPREDGDLFAIRSLFLQKKREAAVDMVSYSYKSHSI